MRLRRKIELCLAGAISSVAVFTAFVPGAQSETAQADLLRAPAVPVPRVNPAHSLNPDLYQSLRISDASRSVATAILRGGTRQPDFFTQEFTPAAQETGTLSIQPNIRRETGDGWEAEAMGFEVRFTPRSDAEGPNWWIMGGAGRESYAVAPSSLRQYTVTPVTAEAVIGDTHVGVALQLSDTAYASLGYVREQRNFSLGREDWEEDEHFIGIGVHARW